MKYKTTNQFIFTSFILFIISSCSLLKVELDTGIKPLPRKELNTRLLLQEFSKDISYHVETLADSIISSTVESELKLNALQWKISVATMSRNTIFQTIPYVALIDTWTFCKQHTDFIEVEGGILFKGYNQLVLREVKLLEDKMIYIARAVSTRKEFDSYQKFVDHYAKAHPFENLVFDRRSLISDINDFLSIPDSLTMTTVGTMPENMADLGARISDFSDKLPKLARWQTESYLIEAGIDSVDIKSLLDSIAIVSGQISFIAKNSPELLDSAITMLNEQLTPLFGQLDSRWGQTLIRLGEERLAMIQAFDEQRQAISESIAIERALIMQELTTMSADIVERSWVHLKALIIRGLVLVLLILIVLLGLPFAIGFVTGKAIARRSIEKG